jgi:hypothetical protein
LAHKQLDAARHTTRVGFCLAYNIWSRPKKLDSDKRASFFILRMAGEAKKSLNKGTLKVILPLLRQFGNKFIFAQEPTLKKFLYEERDF